METPKYGGKKVCSNGPGRMTKMAAMPIYGKRDRSGSLVECLTRDRRAAGLSLTGVTALCP